MQTETEFLECIAKQIVDASVIYPGHLDRVARIYQLDMSLGLILQRYMRELREKEESNAKNQTS